MSQGQQTFKLHLQLQDDSYWLGDLKLCRLLLMNDTQFPWFVLVPRITEISEVYQLPADIQQLCWQESNLLSLAIMQLFQGDKLNIAALGNVVPQLHIHHVVRYTTDICWPAPIWGKYPMQEYQQSEVVKIQQALRNSLPFEQMNQL
ncbi:HIT domain-containing protein [Aliikangiella maris]|uniref:HIT domain-containing protein n=2 Tax=Aliikangiella maris TaxID=3162458 RepID=A0ABV3MLH1_9GAMM